jgi:hypothetical protein
LSNKLYTGVSYTLKTFSPLEAIAMALGVQDIIVDKGTIVRWHHFRFNEPILDSREAGSELGIEFQIQVPKGITTSLGYSRFFSGKALEGIFEDEPWAITSAVTVKI